MLASAVFTPFLLVAMGVSSTAVGIPWNDEQRWVSEMLAPAVYDAATRPVENVTEAVQVTVFVDVFAIIRLDSKDQELLAATSFGMGWQDKRLQWEPSDYNGMESITVKADTLWFPNVLVLNTLDETRLITSDTEVLITSDGEVHIGVSRYHRTQCYLDQEAFPFDFQQCYFLIGTESTPSDTISITPSEASKREEVHTIDNWELKTVRLKGRFSPTCINHNTSRRVSCRHTSQVTVNVCLQRASKYHLVMVIAPITILTLMASVVFWLPPGCGEKLSFSVSVFFGFVVFQLVVQEELADTGNAKASIAIRYVLFNFALVGMAVIESAVTLIMHYREDPKAGNSSETLDMRISRAEGSEQSPPMIQPSDEKKPRDWKRTAKFVDRISFVLFYLTFIAFIIAVVVEVVAADGCPQ